MQFLHLSAIFAQVWLLLSDLTVMLNYVAKACEAGNEDMKPVNGGKH